MPQDSPKNLIRASAGAIVVIAVLAVLAIWLIFTVRPVSVGPTTAPEVESRPTNEVALMALEPYLFAECLPDGIPESYRSCDIEIFKEPEGDPGWRVNVTYSGLYDDSVQATRVSAYFTNENGQWLASDVSETNQCHVGRGSYQDFSSELCI